MASARPLLMIFGEDEDESVNQLTGADTNAWPIVKQRSTTHRAMQRATARLAGAAFALVLGASSVLADDIEVFTANHGMATPNLYFVLDVSGSMGYNTPTGTRLSDLKAAMSEILQGNIDKINAGYSTYSGSAQPPIFNVQDLTASRSAQMQGSINALSAGGGTSSTEALYEALSYLQAASNDPDSVVGSECSETFMVLVSDGMPNNNVPAGLSSNFGINPASCANGAGRCSAEIAAYAANNDMNPSQPGSHVTTFTIGFSAPPAGQAYLQNVAQNGNGEFFAANSGAALRQALEDIIGQVYQGAESFAELTVDVDQSSLSHGNRLFFSLFKPSRQPVWRGNIKGYFRDSSGSLIDTLNQPATVAGPDGMQFSETARSFWSPSVDGADVAQGGANSRINPATRNLFTYTGGTVPSGGVQLNTLAGEHAITTGNADLTAALMNLPDPARREELINWIRNAPMGEALHSKLQIVNYDSGTVVFGMTNQGLFHAIDANEPSTFNQHGGGGELFAFMPPELLQNLPALADAGSNTGEDVGHIYGLDGAISRWHDDHNSDGIVNGDDTLVMIFGMRRGGKAYYALDVTDPLSPEYLWKIEGGVTPGFDDLAQSWSRMSLVTVNRSGAPATPVTAANTDRVLLFAGGYDGDTLDDGNKRTLAAGGAIYMVDRDGSLIWKTDNQMDYSMPADLSVIDSDADGLADRIYAADLGGQIWRVDFDDVESSPGFDVTRLADLGSSGEQPFFYAPAVALPEGIAADYLAIAIGSGDRDAPLDNSKTGRLMVVRDENVEKGAPASTPALITMAELYDATAYDLGSPTSSVRQAANFALDAAHGWFIELDDGEKSLSSVVVLEGKLMATTFQPAGVSLTPSGCETVNTAAFFYSLDLLNGNPADGLDSSDPDLTAADRRRPISTRGIPAAPVLLTNEGTGEVQVMVNKEVALEVNQLLRRAYWHDK